MTKEDIIKPENLVYKKPTLMNDNPMHYCPGCSHGVVHKLIAEVIEEMGMEDKAVGISPVGCAVFIYNYLDIDWQEAAHGRAPALATAIKRLWPDRLVFTYQGDGDLACRPVPSAVCSTRLSAMAVRKRFFVSASASRRALQAAFVFRMISNVVICSPSLPKIGCRWVLPLRCRTASFSHLAGM